MSPLPLERIFISNVSLLIFDLPFNQYKALIKYLVLRIKNT